MQTIPATPLPAFTFAERTQLPPTPGAPGERILGVTWLDDGELMECTVSFEDCEVAARRWAARRHALVYRVLWHLRAPGFTRLPDAEWPPKPQADAALGEAYRQIDRDLEALALDFKRPWPAPEGVLATTNGDLRRASPLQAASAPPPAPSPASAPSAAEGSAPLDAAPASSPAAGGGADSPAQS